MNNFYHSFLKISKLVIFISLLSVSSLYGADGKELFKQNCASCHHPIKDGTGPALKGAKAKWGANGDNIYEWVRNPQAQYEKGVKSAIAIQYNVGGMNGQNVTDEEIDAILAYVDSYEPPIVVTDGQPTASTNNVEESSSWFWFLVIGIILIAIIVSLWGVRRQLKYANQEKQGDKVKEETFKEEVGSWAWRNLKLVSVLGFVATCALVYWLAERGYQVGVFEDYVPEQPIAFNHSIHAGQNEIDCQYCHNSASKSKHAGIPTVNVCMNCHKAIKEPKSGSAVGKAEIAKIHAAAGFDPETNKYTGKTEPIRWIKAHNLPDHVYFSHAQHVEVGKIECENCHGPVKTYTVGRTANSEMINEMAITGEGLRDPQTQKAKIIQLENQVLTMGWCIECHNKADVQMEGSEYYDDIHDRLKRDKELYKSVMEDGKVNVKEFGGWECAKCHY